MSNKQQRGKLANRNNQTRSRRQKDCVVNEVQHANGFLNWGKLEMEMECDDLSWKKVLIQYSDRLLSFVLNSQFKYYSANTKNL